MNVGAVVAAAILILAAVRDVRATWLIYKTHQEQEPPRNFITGALLVIAALVTGTVVWLGGLTALVLLGYGPFAELRPITILLLVAIAFIPDGIRWVYRRVQEGEA